MKMTKNVKRFSVLYFLVSLILFLAIYIPYKNSQLGNYHQYEGSVESFVSLRGLGSVKGTGDR